MMHLHVAGATGRLASARDNVDGATPASLAKLWSE
jgi:hypothetical protein